MKSSCPLRSRFSRLSSPRPRCLHLHSLLLADQRPKASSCAWVIRGPSLGPALCQGLETMQMQKTRGRAAFGAACQRAGETHLE